MFDQYDPSGADDSWIDEILAASEPPAFDGRIQGTVLGATIEDVRTIPPGDLRDRLLRTVAVAVRWGNASRGV